MIRTGRDDKKGGTLTMRTASCRQIPAVLLEFEQGRNRIMVGDILHPVPPVHDGMVLERSEIRIEYMVYRRGGRAPSVVGPELVAAVEKVDTGG